MKVAILTSPNQWFLPYATQLKEKIIDSTLFLYHEDIDERYEIVFMLSYHRIVEKKHHICQHFNPNYLNRIWKLKWDLRRIIWRRDEF